MYGALIIYLLFCRDLLMSLKYWGFKNNPYYPCSMNEVVDGNYCTVFWHVYYLKISHVDSTVIVKILQCLEENYGNVDRLTTTQGNIHGYLGMVLDFITKG